MTTFVQLHFLTVYPPSNPNRDDTGRPKTAVYGGVHRLRLSSQSLKRAARLSPAMSEALKGNMGERTQRLGDEVKSYLHDQGADDDTSQDIAKKVAEVFGKIDAKSKDGVRIRQLAFISPDERKTAMELASKALGGESLANEVKQRRNQILRTADGAVDLAMFGRMLADAPEFNREAAVQVSHAITTHRAEVEGDYYTAADDLKLPSEDMGASFVGEAGFGSGVYYLYVCIDIARLVDNLAGDRALATKAVQAVTEAFATSSPSGKCNSFGHHTCASFIRAEVGSQQPRSLATAFLKPVAAKDLLKASIQELRSTTAKIERAYGASVDDWREMDLIDERGTLAEIKAFVGKQVENE